jgi:hypothetical protein
MNSTSNNQKKNFYEKLKEKKSANVLNEMFKFINTTIPEILNKTDDMSEVSLTVQDFITKCTVEYAKVWEIEFPNNRNAYVEICDGFESLITKSLYGLIMTRLGEYSKFQKLCVKYSFITFKHLGIEFNVDEFDLATQLKSKFYFIFYIFILFRFI